MTGAALLRELLTRGFALRRDGDRLVVRPPRGRELTDDLREAIRQHKAKILHLLEEVEAGPASDAEGRKYDRPPSLLPDGSCFGCGQAGWWLSPARHLACGICHPPAKPEDVRFIFHREVVRYVH